MGLSGSTLLTPFKSCQRNLHEPNHIDTWRRHSLNVELQKSELTKAKERSFRLLSYRARSEKEIVDRLREKRFSRSVIDQTIHDLKGSGLIDDLEFARMWAKSRLIGKKMGKGRIMGELRDKGVKSDIVDTAIDEYFKEVDVEDVALSLLRGRINRYRSLDKNKALKRMSDFLFRRGFEGEVIWSTVQKVWDEIEKDEER